MTASHAPLTPFGYPPAIAARAESRRALERAAMLACLLAITLYAVLFATRGLWSGALQVAISTLPPVHDLTGGVTLESPPAAQQFPVAAPAPPPSASGPPALVPDELVQPAATAAQAGPGEGTAAHPGAGSPDAGGRAEGEGPAGEADTPPPGVWQYTDTLPEAAVRVAAEYPEIAREAGVEGTVVVWALVAADGSVREVRLQHGVPMLDDAALDAVRRWRFVPALANGHPVQVWVAIPMRFTLH